MKLTFLGTGTSQGVPMIGCHCSVCNSTNPRNKRLRTSVVIEEEDFTILIDCSPDLRTQSLRSGLEKIDAILFTHSHSDHILGIDDLRRFNWIQDKRLPAFGSKETLKHIRALFPYAVENDPANARHPYTKIDLHPVEESFELGPFQITPYNLPHGKVITSGFLFKKNNKPLLGYFTDCKDVPLDAREAIRGVRILIIDALRFTEHPTHLAIAESTRIAEEAKAEQTYFIHLTHEIDHDLHSCELPEKIAFAYDDLVVEI